jgi:hypothetical protein
MRRYPFVVYILSVISLPLLPILDIIFMNIGSRTEQEWKDHVDIGPVRRFFGESIASIGILHRKSFHRRISCPILNTTMSPAFAGANATSHAIIIYRKKDCCQSEVCRCDAERKAV